MERSRARGKSPPRSCARGRRGPLTTTRSSRASSRRTPGRQKGANSSRPRARSRRFASRSTTSSARSSAALEQTLDLLAERRPVRRDQLPFARGPHRQALHGARSARRRSVCGAAEYPAACAAAAHARRQARAARRRRELERNPRARSARLRSSRAHAARAGRMKPGYKQAARARRRAAARRWRHRVGRLGRRRRSIASRQLFIELEELNREPRKGSRSTGGGCRSSKALMGHALRAIESVARERLHLTEPSDGAARRRRRAGALMTMKRRQNDGRLERARWRSALAARRRSRFAPPRSRRGFSICSSSTRISSPSKPTIAICARWRSPRIAAR